MTNRSETDLLKGIQAAVALALADASLPDTARATGRAHLNVTVQFEGGRVVWTTSGCHFERLVNFDRPARS